jgi:hypothetical protein
MGHTLALPAVITRIRLATKQDDTALPTVIERSHLMLRTCPTLGAIALVAMLAVQAEAQSPKWTQVGMLSCQLNPSIGFIIAGHQSMECRFAQNAPSNPPQAYAGALNMVGINIGITAGGVLSWAVLAPTAGVPSGALAGEYVGASGDIGLGLGVGTNVLVGGSARTFALQPISVEGSVAVDVALGVSALKLRPLP